MNVNKILIFLLFINTFSYADTQIGSIGYVSPKYPSQRIINRTVSSRNQRADINDFFYDFIELAYDNYGDAVVSVINKLNYKRESVLHKDVSLNGNVLVPTDDEDIQDAIEEFYKNKRMKFKADVAKESKADVLIFSNFSKSHFKNSFKNYKKLKRDNKPIPKETTLIYILQVFDVQTQARSQEFIKVKIEDMFDLPNYDPAVIQAMFEDKYIKLFQKIFSQLSMTGSGYGSDGELVSQESDSSPANTQTPAKEELGHEIKKDSSVPGGDDW